MTRTAQVQTQTKNLRSNDYRVVLATDNEQAFLSCHGNALSSGYHLPARCMHRLDVGEYTQNMYVSHVLSISAYLKAKEVSAADFVGQPRALMADVVEHMLDQQAM